MYYPKTQPLIGSCRALHSLRFGVHRHWSALARASTVPRVYTVSEPCVMNLRALILVLTPVSAIKGLPYLLHQGEVLSLRDYHKWILRPILGLGRDRYVFPVYHPYWLVTTPGVLTSGHIRIGVIFSGSKGGDL